MTTIGQEATTNDQDALQVEAAWFQNVTEALDELSAASAQNRAAFRRSMQTLALMLPLGGMLGGQWQP